MGRPRGLGFTLAIALALGLALGEKDARAEQDVTVTNFGEMDPVVFDHTTHAETHGCEACHHVKRSGGAHRCGTCHLEQETKAGIKLEDAAHKEGVGKCWGCHLKKEARKKLDCEDCHRGEAK